MAPHPDPLSRALRPTALALLLALPGCLSSVYSVPKSELARLAALPPDQRGAAVRVTQELEPSDDPEPADPGSELLLETGLAVGVAVGGPSEPSRRRTTYTRRDGGPRRGGGSGNAAAGSSGGGSGGGDGSGDHERGDDSSDDASSVALAAVLVVGSVIVGGVLAASEGARFDGWAALEPNHPVHLVGPNGEQGWVPLSKLDAGVAAWADEALVVEDEGAIVPLERAPLDRVGFTFGLDLGAASTPVSGAPSSLAWGFASRVSLGAYPLQWLGFDIGLGMLFADTNDDGDTDVEWRPDLEARVVPLAVGPVHLGAYGRIGLVAGGEAARDGAARELDGWLAGGGALLELELTTRLALLARGGVDVLPAQGGASVAPSFAVGLSVY